MMLANGEIRHEYKEKTVSVVLQGIVQPHSIHKPGELPVVNRRGVISRLQFEMLTL